MVATSPLRFNGAAPFRERNVQQQGDPTDGDPGASMEPLPFQSGMGKFVWRTIEGFTELQWSRSLSRAECDVGRGKRILGRHGASMEPLPFESGMASDQDTYLALLGCASMEPLPFESGMQPIQART